MSEARLWKRPEIARLRLLSSEIYGLPIRGLSLGQAHALIDTDKMLTMAVDKSMKVNKLAVAREIDSMASKSDREAILALRAKRRALAAEYAAKVQALVEAEKVFDSEGIEPDREQSDAVSLLELHGQPLHKAAIWALKKIGEPASIGDIVDLLIENSYATSSEKKKLTNSLFVSMRRRVADFAKQPDYTWALAEWEGDPSDEEGA